MAKSSGIPTSVTIGGAVITNDVFNVALSTSQGVWDVTGLDKVALERILLLFDATMTVTGAVNTTASQSHLTLKATGSKAVVIGFPGATYTATMVQTTYDVNRSQSGEYGFSAAFSLSGGAAGVWT